MNEFLVKVEEIVGAPVTAETKFRETPDWSSLMAFSMLVMLETEYGRPMLIDEFQKLETVGELACAAGL